MIKSEKTEKSMKKWQELSIKEQIMCAYAIIKWISPYLFIIFGGTLIMLLLSGLGLMSSVMGAFVVVAFIVILLLFCIKTFCKVTVTRTMRVIQEESLATNGNTDISDGCNR